MTHNALQPGTFIHKRELRKLNMAEKSKPPFSLNFSLKRFRQEKEVVSPEAAAAFSYYRNPRSCHNFKTYFQAIAQNPQRDAKETEATLLLVTQDHESALDDPDGHQDYCTDLRQEFKGSAS